jgi:signal transduction histidine kinase
METMITSSLSGSKVSWDLKVTSAPVTLRGERFFLFMIENIGDQKRRRALERIFFHDILNIAGNLNGILSILKKEKNEAEIDSLLKISEETSRNLLDEIKMQRQLREAENGDLQVNPERFFTLEFLRSVAEKMCFIDSSSGKGISIEQKSADMELNTDRIILQRILINLIKNALEATDEGGTVTLGCDNSEGMINLWVHNDAEIPRDVQLNIFQRSFSTRGKGRGLGTYSVRLLTENYLKGKVSFTSGKGEGTRFTVSL